MRCARCDYLIEARQESVTEVGVQYHAYCFEKMRAAGREPSASATEQDGERGNEPEA